MLLAVFLGVIEHLGADALLLVRGHDIHVLQPETLIDVDVSGPEGGPDLDDCEIPDDLTLVLGDEHAVLMEVLARNRSLIFPRSEKVVRVIPVGLGGKEQIRQGVSVLVACGSYP